MMPQGSQGGSTGLLLPNAPAGFHRPPPPPPAPVTGAGDNLPATGNPLDHGDPLAAIVVLLQDQKVIQHEMAKAQKDLVSLVTREAMMGGSAGALRAARGAAAGGVDYIPGGGAAPAIVTGAEDIPKRTARMKPPMEPDPVTGAPAEEDRGYHPQPFFKNYQEGRGLGLRDIRTNVADRLAHGMSNWELGPETSKAPEGALGGHGPKGYFVHDRQGRVTDYAAPGTKQYRSIRRKKAATQLGKGIVQRVGKGESLAGSISNEIPIIGTVAGVAGAAVKGVTFGTDFAESQRKANLEYQRVLGGDSNAQFGERFKTWAFQRSQMGIMGSEEAAQLRKGAMNIWGNNQNRRVETEQFGVQMYRNLGMDVEESLGVVKQASENGITSLTELAKALENVSESATKAGGNAEEARKHFEEVFKTSGGQFGAQGGTAAAQATANMQTGLGDQYKDWKFQGMSPTMARQTAGRMGMRPNQMFAMGRTTAGQAKIAHAREDDAKQKLSGMFGPQTKALVNEKRSQYKDGFIPEAAWEEIAAEAMGLQDCADPMTVYYVLQQQGIELPDGQDPLQNPVGVIALGLRLASQKGALGSNELDQRAAAEAAPQKKGEEFLDKGRSPLVTGADSKPGQGSFTEGQLDAVVKASSVSPKDFDHLRSGINKMAEREGKDRAAQDLTIRHDVLGRTGLDLTQEEYSEDGFGLGAQDQAKNIYANAFSKGKMKDRNMALEQLITGKWDENRKFIVKTKDGDKQVNTADLVRYYGDQVAAGDVTIAAGEGKGQKVTDYLGFKGTGAKAGSAEAGAQGSAENVDPNYAKDAAGGKQTEPFKLIVGIDPKAKGIINAYPGSPNIQMNQQTGQAGSGQTYSSTRPGG